MPANTVPIYSRLGDVQIIESMTAANNTIDITTGTSYLAFTADATNGGFVQKIVIKVNPANNSAASVARVWLKENGKGEIIVNGKKPEEYNPVKRT